MNMQKTSDQIEELLFKYFANHLTETEEKELLIWLEADFSHKKILYQMADWWAMAHIPLFISDLEADFAFHLKKLSNEINPVQKKNDANAKFWYKIAASVIILITVGVSSFYLGKNLQPFSPIAYYETSVPLGSQSKITLPDQSVVWLNAGSSLTYYEDQNHKTRNISLAGEGYFEVTPNPDKPFIVNSDNMHITVLGTSFNLKAYKDDTTINLTLISGKVDVNLVNEIQNMENYILSPNQQLAYNKEKQTLEISTVVSANYGRWKDRILKFEEKSFNQLAKDLERIYNIPVEIKSDILAKERFSGSFSYDYSLDYILQEVDVEKKFKWTYQENKLIISDK